MYQVGDKLWYVANNRRQSSGSQYEVIVTKVGRKWIYVAPDSDSRVEFRIDPDTLWADGGRYTSPGKCYSSKEVYEEEMYSMKLFQELRRKMEHSKDVGSKEVLKAAKILGYTLESEKQNGTNDPGPS